MSNRYNFLLPEADNTDTYFKDLGLSYDSPFMRIRRAALVGLSREESSRPPGFGDSFEYRFTSDQRDFSKTVRSSASGKASYGLGSGKASSNVTNFFETNDYSCYLYGYIRIAKPRVVFDPRDSVVESNLMKIIKKNYRNNRDNVEKLVGDEVITGVLAASELMVKLEIQTHSESNKREIKAQASGSYGTFASGGGSFNKISGKIKNSKRIILTVMGDFPEQFMHDISPASADKMLLDYTKLQKARSSIVEYETTKITELPEFIEYSDLIDGTELKSRKNFIYALDTIYQDYVDWRNNIRYVTSDDHKKEFRSHDISLAASHLIACQKEMMELRELHDSAMIHWDKFGKNDKVFEMNYLDKFMDDFPNYPRIEPTPISVPPPARKPQRDRADHHGHEGVGGAHGGRG